MITLDAQQAGRALGIGPLVGAVSGVSIDSRSLRPGDLFVALRGERFDGHNFVEAAFAAGASGAVVEEGSRLEQSVSGSEGAGAGGVDKRAVYEVPDTLEALGGLAREVRRTSSAEVFAITGSVGKTSTKDLLQAMVARVRRVVATSGNQNNEVGVPLTLLALESDSEAAVVEMGMRGRGQIEALTAVAEPDVGIITNIHPVHLELLGTLEGVAAAKAELLAGLQPGGVAVVPAGCAPLEPHLPGCRCRVLSFGVGPEGAGVDVTGWLEKQADLEGAVWVLRWPEGEARIETDDLPSYTLENAIAAAAACYGAGLSMEDCAQGIADVRFSAGRGEIIEVGGLCLIDDTYNANPAAMRMAVDGLVRLAASRKARAVAVLGDMLELGPDTESFHEEIGTYAAEAGIQMLWGVGPVSEATVEGFRNWWRAKERSGEAWSSGNVDSSETVAPVVDSLRPGDVVLFKASRGVQLDKMVSKVVAESASGRWTDGPD